MGAGAEDGEFWLRAGAYGFKAAKVTDKPLFNYSYGSGLTASSEYSEIDYYAWHPWASDGQHPFMSYANSVRQSHPVRQYDEPLIIVIIPVGPGHENNVINALDSLEAQTFRNWEVVVVNDTGSVLNLLAYPYTKIIDIGQGNGAGESRNEGVHAAKAPLLFFLDADDTLHPQALEKFLNLYSQTSKIIYSDFVSKGVISPEYAADRKAQKKLLEYDKHTSQAVWTYSNGGIVTGKQNQNRLSY